MLVGNYGLSTWLSRDSTQHAWALWASKSGMCSARTVLPFPMSSRACARSQHADLLQCGLVTSAPASGVKCARAGTAPTFNSLYNSLIQRSRSSLSTISLCTASSSTCANLFPILVGHLVLGAFPRAGILAWIHTAVALRRPFSRSLALAKQLASTKSLPPKRPSVAHPVCAVDWAPSMSSVSSPTCTLQPSSTESWTLSIRSSIISPSSSSFKVASLATFQPNLVRASVNLESHPRTSPRLAKDIMAHLTPPTKLKTRLSHTAVNQDTHMLGACHAIR